MERHICCFLGHRKLPRNKIEGIVKRLHIEMENLIQEGVTDFLSAGALGFDLLAAALIAAKKETGSDIRLIFMLPCRKQDELWNDDEKRLYHHLLQEADKTVYVSDEYDPGCMEKGNRAMVDRADVCVCALVRRMSGTAQTVDDTQRKGLEIINVAG